MIDVGVDEPGLVLHMLNCRFHYFLSIPGIGHYLLVHYPKVGRKVGEVVACLVRLLLENGDGYLRITKLEGYISIHIV